MLHFPSEGSTSVMTDQHPDAARAIQVNFTREVHVHGGRNKFVRVEIPETVAFRRAAASGFYFPKLLEWYLKRKTQRRVRKDATAFLLEEIEQLPPAIFDGIDTEYLRKAVSGANVYNLLQVAELLKLAKQTNPHEIDLRTVLEHKDAEGISLKNVEKGLIVMGRTRKDREEDIVDIGQKIRGSTYTSYRPHNPLQSSLGVAAIEDAMNSRDEQPGRGGHPILVVATIANSLNLMRDKVASVVNNPRNKTILDKPFGLGPGDKCDKTLPQIRKTVKNLANQMLYFTKQLSEVSRVEEITMYASTCMHLVNVLPPGGIASDPPFHVPVHARVIDLGNGTLIERSDEDAQLVEMSLTPKGKPDGVDKEVTHHVSYRTDLPRAFNGIRTDAEVLAKAVQMGVKDEEDDKGDELRMPSPYIGMTASALLNSLKTSYEEGRMFEGKEGLTLYGMRYKAAQAALNIGNGDEKKRNEMLDGLKPEFHHNDRSNMIAESYSLVKKCSDVVELPTKKELSHIDDAVLAGIIQKNGDRLKSVRVPQDRFATQRAIDAAVYFLHDTRDRLKAQLDKAGPTAAVVVAGGSKKRKRSAPPPTGAEETEGDDKVMRAMIASAYRSFSSICDPDLLFSEIEVETHKRTLEDCRLNTWNKLHKVLQSYPLRFDLDKVDLRLCNGVQLPEKIKETIQKAFLGGVPPPIPPCHDGGAVV